jgi:putative ABC transport system substrate-binding protein
MLVGLGLAGLGVSASAQPAQAKLSRIAYMTGASPQGRGTMDFYAAFRSGLKGLGHVEGEDVLIQPRWYAGDLERMVIDAAELAAWRPDVFVAASTPGALAAVRATRGAVPVVFLVVSDPVGSGLVASLARPGGMATGLTDFGVDVGPKTIDLARTLMPNLKAVGVAVSNNPVHPAQLSAMREAARSVDIRVLPVAVNAADDLEKAMASLDAEGARVLVILGGPPQISMREKIAEHALRWRIAAIGPFRQYAEAGALLSYGPNLTAHYRHAAWYVHRILRGAAPADLPVQQPTEVELILNRRVARSLNLALPQTLLVQAADIIE